MKNVSVDFAHQLLKMNHVTVHFVTPPCDNNAWLDCGLRDTILYTEDAQLDINTWLRSFAPNKIYHITDDFQCNYTALCLPDSDARMVCGPVLFEKICSARFDQICERVRLPQEFHDYLRDYYCRIPFCPSQTLYASIFIILANQLFGENQYEITYTDMDDMHEWYQSYGHYYRIPDKPLLSVQMIEERYDLENAMLTAVSNGNEEKAMETMTKWTSCFMPQRLSNELRDSKNYTVTLNTLLRKTAEQAGVHPIHIDNFSNRNIQLTEQLTSVDQCGAFQKKLVRGYCRLIRKHNLKNHSLLTQKVITYVDTDLCADLSLKSLSDLLSVNASYLSTLFKKEMGMPLTDFVNHRRIQYAQKLLVSTETPIKLIAIQCGIPDVYYFSRLFKRITGTTPKAYRNNTSSYEKFQELCNSVPDSPDTK